MNYREFLSFGDNCNRREHEMPICKNFNTKKTNCDRKMCCSICPESDDCKDICIDLQGAEYLSNLRLVEIELFSYCNRKCAWCPNSFIDRMSHNEYLSIDTLLHVLYNLKYASYKGPITFSRYNEPLSDHQYLKSAISIIKNILPNNKLITNTNGDYITNEVLDGLLIDELTIMDYESRGLEYCKSKLEKVGATIQEIKHPYIYATRGDMKILYVTSWVDIRNITDRGGVLKHYSADIRTKKCDEPTYFLGINHDGTVSPCCNVRNDIDSLKPYILGDLNQQTLLQIVTSDKAVNFRTQCSLAHFEEGSPCYTCSNNGGRYTRGEGSIFYE